MGNVKTWGAIALFFLLAFGFVNVVFAGVPNSMGFPITDYQGQFACDGKTYYHHWHTWYDADGILHGGH